MIPDRAVLEVLFEGAPRFLDRLLAAAPFDDGAAMFAAARSIAHGMPEPEQVELIDAHPRLGAPAAAISALSRAEQGYDRDAADREAGARDREAVERDRAAVERDRERIAAELDRLNAAYEARFGFRYCVFVADRSRSELLPDMTAALGADRIAELHRALDAVVDIAVDRHAKLSAEALP